MSAGQYHDFQMGLMEDFMLAKIKRWGGGIAICILDGVAKAVGLLATTSPRFIAFPKMMLAAGSFMPPIQ